MNLKILFITSLLIQLKKVLLALLKEPKVTQIYFIIFIFFCKQNALAENLIKNGNFALPSFSNWVVSGDLTNTGNSTGGGPSGSNYAFLGQIGGPTLYPAQFIQYFNATQNPAILSFDLQNLSPSGSRRYIDIGLNGSSKFYLSDNAAFSWKRYSVLISSLENSNAIGINASIYGGGTYDITNIELAPVSN